MKKKIIAGLIAIVVIAVSVTVTMESGGATQPTQAAWGDAAKWLHFGFDSSYTAYNPVESTISITNVAQLERKWGIGCDDGYFSVISRSPAIFNGTLYTSGAGSKLIAYDNQTGQMLWQFGNGNAGWAPQPVVSEDGIAFYMEGSNPTHLYAVDADNGNELWEAPIAFDLGFSDTAMVTIDEINGLVYIVETPFGRGEGKLFALDKQTGEIIWYKSKATDNTGFKGDYVLISEGTIFVAAELPNDYTPPIYCAERMLSINASSHEIEVIFGKPEEIELDKISKYTLCNGNLIVTFCDRDDVFESIGTLVVYDVASQAVLWQKEYSTAVTGRIACNTTRNVIYVPTDSYLYALNATTGEEIWKYIGYGEIYNPSVANGIVYFLSDTNMYAIDEATGVRLFSYPLGQEAYDTTQVAICDGMLYFSGNGGTCDLYALGLNNQVVTPTFSPLPKTYNTAQNVTISCKIFGATIYYTTNGDDPTSSSTQYLDAIAVASTTTIKAIAIKEGTEYSDAATGTYTIEDPFFGPNWLHFGYDAQYTSCNPVESTITIDNISQLERKWGIGCDDGYFSVISQSPAIYNATLYTRFYTGPAQSKLHAYDARTGQMLWQFSNDNIGRAHQPVISEDSIIFDMEGSNPTHLYAVDANNGNELWEAPIAFDLRFSDTALVTVDEANDLVYIVEVNNGKLYALHKQTGEIVWYKSEATDDIAFEGDYALLSAGKILVKAEVQLQEHRMLSINASSHEIEIIFDKPEGIELDDISKYTLCNDNLIVTFCDRDDSLESIGTLVVYDVTSQAVLWQKEYSTAITGRIASNTTRNVIYVPTDPYLYALNATNGEEVWKYMGYGEIYNPSVANGIVYFLSDTNMYAIDEATGELLFSYPLGQEAYDTTQVAICDGMLYFSGNGGDCDLYALGLLPVSPIFDTGSGTYPSIMGIHNGTIIPSHKLNASNMYTYACKGTGGHSEYVRIYNESGTLAVGHGNGYQEDYHTITLTPSITLLKDYEYNYTLITGSYPQIHHTDRLEIDDGVITCTSFVDANGKEYSDWIPAIKLE